MKVKRYLLWDISFGINLYIERKGKEVTFWIDFYRTRYHLSWSKK